MTIYKRAFAIYIDNPLNGTPTCTFQQERVAEIDGEVVKETIGELKVIFDPADPIAAQVYQLLYDYYVNLITPPPAQEQPAEPTEAPPTE